MESDSYGNYFTRNLLTIPPDNGVLWTTIYTATGRGKRCLQNDARLKYDRVAKGTKQSLRMRRVEGRLDECCGQYLIEKWRKLRIRQVVWVRNLTCSSTLFLSLLNLWEVKGISTVISVSHTLQITKVQSLIR